MKNRWYVVIFLSFFVFFKGFSQGKPLNPVKDKGLKSKVELIKADSLVGLNMEYTLMQFYGHVVFRHQGATLYCNTAVQNSTNNTIEAFGNIKIAQGDTLTVTGDTLYYDGNTRFAKVYGRKVIMKDKKVVLETRQMNYNLASSDAYYSTRGKIKQDSSLLFSDRGNYNTRTKLFNYRGNVEIVHPKYKLTTQELDYDANTRLATFLTETDIESKDGNIHAKSGTYNTKTQEANLKGRSKVVNENYTLEADTLFFDKAKDAGIAIGDVEFVSLKDNVVLNGKRANRNGEIGLTTMLGQARMKSFDKTDTLYLRADTLFAYEYIKGEQPVRTITDSTEKQMKLLIADGNVKIFRNDLQSISDSLRYDLKDSTIRFFRNPILWNSDNQLEADTIIAKMVNNKIKKMWLMSGSFIVAQDSVANFNQIKGRQIQAIFNDSTDIEKVLVEGNGESIYFAVDDKNKLIGLNRVECSRMELNFNDRKVKRILFRGKPESRLIPPSEIGSKETKLDSFEWKIDQKPKREDVVFK